MKRCSTRKSVTSLSGLDLTTESSNAMVPITTAPPACRPASLDPSAVTVPGAPGNADLAPAPPPDDWHAALQLLRAGTADMPLRPPQTATEAVMANPGVVALANALADGQMAPRALRQLLAVNISEGVALGKLISSAMGCDKRDTGTVLKQWLPLRAQANQLVLANVEVLLRLDAPVAPRLRVGQLNAATVQQVVGRIESRNCGAATPNPSEDALGH